MCFVIYVIQVVHVLLQRTVKSAVYIMQCKVYTIQCTLIHVLLHVRLQTLALRRKSAGPGTVPDVCRGAQEKVNHKTEMTEIPQFNLLNTNKLSQIAK